MTPMKIKKLLSSYQQFNRFLGEGHRFLFPETPWGERSAAARYLKRYALSLSPRLLRKSLLLVEEVSAILSEALLQEKADCQHCVTQLFFRGKSHIYVEMNFYLSESTQRRLLNHFIGRLYVLLQRTPELRRKFLRVYKIFHPKNN